MFSFQTFQISVPEIECAKDEQIITKLLKKVGMFTLLLPVVNQTNALVMHNHEIEYNLFQPDF